MMPSTILDIAQEACDAAELNLVRPSTLFASANEGDTTDRKVLRALNRTGRALAAANDWQALRREHLFTSLAAEVQTGIMPTDFLRFVPSTFINRATRLEIIGPTPPDQWQWIKAGMAAAAVSQYMQRGNDILIYPTLGAGQTLAFEYVCDSIGRGAAVSFTGNTTNASTTVAVANTAGLAVGQIVGGTGILPYARITAVSANVSVTLSLAATATGASVALTATPYRSRFSADTDVPLWDDELMILGAIYHLRNGEGYDAAVAERDFRVCWSDRLKRDGGARIYDMSGMTHRSIEARLAAMKNAVVVTTS